MKITRSLLSVWPRPTSAPAAIEDTPAPFAGAPRDAGFLLFDPSVAPLLDAAEAGFPHTSPEDLPALLASVPLDVFALLATYRPARWPRLAAWLPDMPEDDVQLGMTGAVGEAVMLKAAGFVRRLLPACAAYMGRPLNEARVLDYGIGWARVARLFYKFTPTDRLHGVDAWPASLGMAELAGFRGPLALIDPVPDALPFQERFDLVYAFSVFTHLSERTARAAVRAIRAGMADDGLFALTVRPGDFWRESERPEADARLAEHAARGFAFQPADVPPTRDGDVPYGDSSTTLDYIRGEWPEFEIAAVEINGADPYQMIVLLRPA